MLIDGHWTDAVDGGTFLTTDPFTGLPWASLQNGGEADAQRAVDAARAAFEAPAWRGLGTAKRSDLLRRLGGAIRAHAEEIGFVETRDNGKLLRETVSQARFSADCFEWFAGAADKLAGDVIDTGDPNTLDYTTREPLGPCVLLLAWNSPIQFIANKAAPALAMGNTVVIKPSEHAPASAIEFAALAAEVGFPDGVINVVTGDGPDLGRALVDAEGVALVSLTGGVDTGRIVAARAGAKLRPTVMELGGKSPNIVFADAGQAGAVNGVMAGIFAAGGQTCIAGARLLVEDPIHDSFVEELCRRANAVVLGDPLEPTTEMGPMANQLQFAHVQSAIGTAGAEGAVLSSPRQADLPAEGGLFIAPTIFTEVVPSMSIARDEVFGPVLSVTRFQNEAEAVALANESRFGLAAGVWTSEISKALRVARDVVAGTVWVNTYRSLSPAAPFGGFADSGYGRERGLEALRDYSATKNVMIEISADGSEDRDPFTARTKR